MQAEKSRIIAKFNPAKQNTTSEPEPQPRYYADPDLLNEKCRQLENIPFVLVEEESRSKSSEKRIEQLELELRKASKEKRRPNIELDSTILLGPLMGGWPQIDLEEESDVEYPLVETEEEWFEWKEKIDKKRAQKLQASSHLPKDGKVMSSTRPKKLLEQPVAKKAIDLPSTSLQILQDYADEKENEFNRIIQEVATEVTVPFTISSSRLTSRVSHNGTKIVLQEHFNLHKLMRNRWHPSSSYRHHKRRLLNSQRLQIPDFTYAKVHLYQNYKHHRVHTEASARRAVKASVEPHCIPKAWAPELRPMHENPMPSLIGLHTRPKRPRLLLWPTGLL